MKRIATIVVASVIVASCSVAGGMPSGSASDAVKAFYAACNDGKYSEAEKYLAPEAQQLLTGGLGALGGGLRGYCDHQTKKGNLQKVEIVAEEVRGEGADVRFKLHYKNGQSKDDHELMIKKDGSWKIGTGR